MNGISDLHHSHHFSALATEPAAASPAIAKRHGLPPTPPPPCHSTVTVAAADISMDDTVTATRASGLPPRKAHRRSRSDVPFAYLQSSTPHLPAPKMEASWGLANGDVTAAAGGGGDDLFNAYLNLEGFDALNSSDERHDEGDSRGSSMKTNGADSSENESEGSAGESRGFGIQLWDKREGVKRNATGDPARHARSLSMDSLMGKLNFSVTESVGLPLLMGQRAAGHAANGGSNKFSLEFGSGEFTPAEMKKIMADEKLAEMALADPKRVKRVLANRQSAARSKERKMRYIAELEQKVQILQTEATTLSAQLTLLQRDSAGLVTQNNELKFRLQAMEQQAQLRDALNEALTAEVQRLKLATTELGDSCSSNNLAQQIQLNSQNQMFQLQQQRQQQQQSAPIPFYQLQQPQQNGAATNHESKE